MPDSSAERQRSSSVPPPGGIGEVAASALGTLLDYFHARLALLSLEAREARGAFALRLVCGVAAFCFLLIGWMALVAGGIGWLAQETGWAWPLISMVVALAHLAAGLLFLLGARRRFAAPPFRDSLNELEKDRQWLKRQRPEN